MFNDINIADEQAVQAEVQAEKEATRVAEQAAAAKAEQDAKDTAAKAEQDARDAAAKIAQETFLNAVQQVTPFAQQYRGLLVSYFGVNAEINQTISQAYVLSYFAVIVASGTITAQQTADASLLQTLFSVLTPVANDPSLPQPNTWYSIFWDLIPQPVSLKK